MPHDACKAPVGPLLRSLLLVSSYQLVMPLGAEHPAAWHQFRLVPSAVTGAPAQVAMGFGFVIKRLPEAPVTLAPRSPGKRAEEGNHPSAMPQDPGAWPST